jgi:hypothetical protein
MSKQEALMSKKLIVAAVAVAFATPALAAEFYVVQDTSTKRCQIVEQKPTASTTVVVGGGKVYTSRTEAESALGSVEVCKTTTGTGAGSSTTTTTIERK